MSARRSWARLVRKLGGGNEMVLRDRRKEGVGRVVASGNNGTAAVGVRTVVQGESLSGDSIDAGV